MGRVVIADLAPIQMNRHPRDASWRGKDFYVQHVAEGHGLKAVHQRDIFRTGDQERQE